MSLKRTSGINDDAVSVVQSDNILDLRNEIKNGKPMRTAWEHIAEFSMNSTLHGVRYMFEPRRHWTERAWWVLAFLLSVAGCGLLIRNVFNKWDQTPTIITFADKLMPVWEIPFPAVTICPETKTDPSKLNFTDKFYELLHSSLPYNVSDVKFARMEAVLQICNAEIAYNLQFNQHFSTNIIQLLQEIAPTIELKKCTFRKKLFRFRQMFQQLMTEDGLCFTFNMLNSREIYQDGISNGFRDVIDRQTADHWSLDNGYDQEISVNAKTHYPYRVHGAGAHSGMSVETNQFSNQLDYMCRGSMQGLKIVLHNPVEMPLMSSNYIRIAFEQDVMVAVKPIVTTTSQGLQDYEWKRRQCFFASDRSLKFFKVYTQRNCELECLTNFTMHSCGCVRFYMPRNDTTPVCGVAKMKCYNYAEDYDYFHGLVGRWITEKCNCLPACTSITYEAEVMPNDMHWGETVKTILDSFELLPSRFSISFKEKQFLALRRSELYGYSDLVANCGGLLGLFLGVSLLSIVELIYYCTLRLFCNLRVMVRNRTQASPSVVEPALSGTVCH